jgi:hypothetical protein
MKTHLILRRALLAAAVFSVALPARAENLVTVRVVSPRFSAEVPAGQDKITIVVEVEDATEEGINLKKGIPVFDPPTYKDAKVNEAVKDNLDLFLKNLVAVTSYTRKTKPLGRNVTVYQLTSVLKTALLGSGCQVAVAPKAIPPGVRQVPAAGYKSGAEFEFRIGNSQTDAKQDVFSSDLCLVVASSPGS